MVESARGKEFVAVLIAEYEQLIRIAKMNLSLAQNYLSKYQYDENDKSTLTKHMQEDQQDIEHYSAILAELKGENNGSLDIHASTVSSGMRGQASGRGESLTRVGCTTVL